LVLLIIANQSAFSLGGIRLNLFYPLVTLLLLGAYFITQKYFREEKRSKEIRQMFSSYVTERVVNQLIENPELARLGGERREVTVLFSDVRAFTSFSETHAPEEVVAMLNEYLEAMTEVVFQWEGTLDKFIGDAIMAFWGAPLKQENHSELAVKCSLHMIKRLEELQKKWKAEGKYPFDIGIGINTGDVLVGNIGAEDKKMDYTIIGDHVNLSSRVESLTKKYGNRILITEYTLERIRNLVQSGSIAHIYIKGLEQVIVKGKEKSVGIYGIESMPHGEESSITAYEERVVRLRNK
jgi:adenylate cyclase